ncbi:MAG: integrase arm-type DNA-binding domain-containing protein [Azonexus sp.]|jgi:integrase|nr:integrase arm-type DNA-binding domain-containing protein [Azonexus sp.]
MPLTDTAIRQAKPTDKPAKLADGGGLYLLINRAGKYWRWDYRYADKRKTLALGVYPETGLAKARERHKAARALLADGVDPGQAKQEKKRAAVLAAENSFRAVAEKWLDMRAPTWSHSHLVKTRQLLKRDVYPMLGMLPIASITSAKALEMARKIEARGAYEMPRVALVAASQVFKFAIGLGHIENDPAQGMSRQLNPRPPVEHYPHVTQGQLPDMLRKLDAMGSAPTVLAVKLNMLTFIRGGELRWAEWSEFDLDKKVWTVPTGRMKGSIWLKQKGNDHVVPLSRQALAVLGELRPLTGHHALLFPGRDNPKNALTGAAMNKVFHRMGLKGEQSVHGLRGLASTLLNESGVFNERVIEAQLSHKERNAVKAAYNHALYLPERTRLMDWWGNYLEHQAGENVMPLTMVA